MTPTDRPPLPPFNTATAAQKARMAEDAWNSRDPARGGACLHARLALAQSRGVPSGPRCDRTVLTREMGARTRLPADQEVWAFHDNRIAVRFAYEWRDDSGQWFRSYGNENWEFDAHGLMQTRFAASTTFRSARRTASSVRPQGRRPDDHPGLSVLGL